jgi:putative hydroxymethylpyrimidine transport system permease protein
VTVLSRSWPMLLLLLAWQVWVGLGHVAAIVAPPPLAVALALAAHPLDFLREGFATLLVALAGLVLGGMLSVALAVVAWFSPLATGAISFPALLVQATPLVALMPVIARVLGYGQPTVVAAAALIAFFPTFVLAVSGLHALPPGAGDLLTVLGASRLTRLRLLALPAAEPNLLTALRISAANCVLAALVAEYLMGTTGLGRLFAVSESAFEIPRAWAACLVAMVLSVLGYLGAQRLETIGKERFLQ